MSQDLCLCDNKVGSLWRILSNRACLLWPLCSASVLVLEPLGKLANDWRGCLTSDLFSMGCSIDPTNMHNCDIRSGAFLECRDLLWPFAGKSYIFISICGLRPMHAALQCVVVSQVDGCGECSISPLWSSDLPGQANHHAIYMGWMYFFKKVNLMQIDLHWVHAGHRCALFSFEKTQRN